MSGDKITMEFKPEDAEMISAWQRQRNNIQEFTEHCDALNQKTQQGKDHADRFMASWSRGLSENTDKLTTFFTGFELGKGLLDNLLSGLDKWEKKMENLVEKKKQLSLSLEHELAGSGKLQFAPQAEKAIREMEGGTNEEKKAALSGIMRAAPKMDIGRQLALTDELQKSGGAFSEEQLGSLGGIAATLAQVDKSKSAKEITGLAIQQFEATRGDERGALSDKAAVAALTTLKKAGFSTEKAAAFLSESANQGLGAREVQGIASKLVDPLAFNMHPHSAEEAAANRFAGEKDPMKRFEMLQGDAKIRAGVLQGHAEKFSHIDESVLAGEESTWGANEGKGVASDRGRMFLAANPLEVRERKADEKIARGGADTAKSEQQIRVEGKEAEAEWTDQYGAGALSDITGGWTATGSKWSKRAFGVDIPKKVMTFGDDMVLAPGQKPAMGLLSRAAGYGGKKPAAEAGPAGDHADLQRETNRLLLEQNGHLAKQTEKLNQIAANKPSVAVNVHGGGGAAPFIDPSQRGAPSASGTLQH